MAAHATISQAKGSTGAEVTLWQNLLTTAGFATTVSGVFDSATTAKTKAWQAKSGLTPDGVVGPMSWSKMTGEAPPAAGPVAEDIASVPGLADNTDNAFRYALAQMASRLKTNPDYIVAAMAVETGKTFSPSAENPLSHAIGLIQFMPNGSAASLTGLPKGTGPGSGFEFLKNLSAIAQLEFVEKYFKPFAGKMGNPNDAYLAVFWPAAMGKPADYVIAESGTKVYEQNKGFDKDKSGFITAGEVGAAAQWMLDQAAKVARIPITPEQGPPPDVGGGPWPDAPPGSSGFLPLVAGLGLLGGGWYLWQSGMLARVLRAAGVR